MSIKRLSNDKDDEWKKELEKVKQEHNTELAKLRGEIKVHQARVKLSQDEAKMRNGFDTRERALLQDIRNLKTKIELQEKELKEERQLIKDNFQANTDQRKALKQARQDLAEFEAMKAELIELKRGIAQHTEVKDAIKRMESETRKTARAAEKEVRRLQGALNAAKEELQMLREEEGEGGGGDDDGMDA